MHLNELVTTTTSNPNPTHVTDSSGKQVMPSHPFPTTHTSLPLPLPFPAAGSTHALGHTSATFYNQTPPTSTLIHSLIAKDMPHSSTPPLTTIHTLKTVFQFHQTRICVPDFSYKNYPSQSLPNNPNPSLHFHNHKPSITTPPASSSSSSYQQLNKHLEYGVVPTGTELVPYGEGRSQSKFTTTQNLIRHQDRTLPTPESTQRDSTECQSTLVTVAVPEFNSRKRPATPAAVKDRQRQTRINEKLKSLHELLPHNDQGKKVAMENIVDYVKYLQLHAKALSRIKLCDGEATNNPFIHLEGFGHYLLYQQSLNEPLEEIIGKMMKDNMPAVTQLLETKGLYLMPTSLAEGISTNI